MLPSFFDILGSRYILTIAFFWVAWFGEDVIVLLPHGAYCLEHPSWPELFHIYPKAQSKEHTWCHNGEAAQTERRQITENEIKTDVDGIKLGGQCTKNEPSSKWFPLLRTSDASSLQPKEQANYRWRA